MKQNKASKSTGINLSRRQVLKAAAAVTASATLPGCGGDTSSTTQTAANPLAAAIDTVGNKLQPNILFILVDEMRFPKVFPAGISTAEQFLQKFMPNTYQLWAKGVKFSNHITATTHFYIKGLLTYSNIFAFAQFQRLACAALRLSNLWQIII